MLGRRLNLGDKLRVFLMSQRFGLVLFGGLGVLLGGLLVVFCLVVVFHLFV